MAPAATMDIWLVLGQVPALSRHPAHYIKAMQSMPRSYSITESLVSLRSVFSDTVLHCRTQTEL